MPLCIDEYVLLIFCKSYVFTLKVKWLCKNKTTRINLGCTGMKRTGKRDNPIKTMEWNQGSKESNAQAWRKLANETTLLKQRNGIEEAKSLMEK